MRGLCVLVSKKYAYSALISILTNVTALIISLPFTLLFTCLLTAHFFFKWIILFVCSRSKSSVFYGAGSQLLRNGELEWIELQPESIMHSVLVFDSKVNVSRIRELICSRVIPLYPKLTHKAHPLPYMANSAHCWIQDKEFNIEQHVYYDRALHSEEELQDYMSKEMFEHLPACKPPWELRILSRQHGGCSFSSDTIIVLRIHQSLADAMKLIKILCTKLADTKSSFSYIIDEEHYSWSYYARAIQTWCIGPAVILYRLALSAINRLWIKTEHGMEHRVHWSTSISLYKVERIQQVTRSSNNCVMLSAISGALRYLLQKSGVPHPPNMKVVLPVTVDRNKQYLPVSLSVPTSIEGAIPRLWKTKYELNMLSKSYDPFITFIVCSILMPVCPSRFRSFLTNVYKKNATVQFGLVSGPNSRLVIDGSPLKSIYSFLPAERDVSVSVSAITYADQVCVSVVTNSSLGEAGKVVLAYIEEQVEQMFSLLMNRATPEEQGAEYFQNQLPDVSRVPFRDLKGRMQLIQYEMQKLNELIKYSEDDMKHYARLKCEFQHVFKEIKRRRTMKSKRRKRSLLLKGIESVNRVCSLRSCRITLQSIPSNVTVSERTLCYENQNSSSSESLITKNITDIEASNDTYISNTFAKSSYVIVEPQSDQLRQDTPAMCSEDSDGNGPTFSSSIFDSGNCGKFPVSRIEERTYLLLHTNEHII